jgi:ABC-type Fe3+/spermidine/putrescine transport system ATPase subunit
MLKLAMNVIEFKNVSKVYDNRTIWGVHSLNFEVKRGEIYTIMGPSGGGKTTTLDLISGKVLPDEGIIERSQDFEISYLKSDTFLDESKTVLENILSSITKKMTDQQATTLARQSLSDLALTNEIAKYPKELSSGQYQRALIACCLSNSPDLLLFDEPFGNIDQELKNEILDIILPVVKEKELTIIWVTHHLREAFQYSDRMLILNFGKIQQISSPQRIYFNPANMFVANFIELENMFICDTSLGKKGFFDIKSKVFNGSIPYESENYNHERQSLLIIRPEGIVLNERSTTKAKLIEKRFSGPVNYCIFELDSKEKIYGHISSYVNIEVGTEYGININTQFISLINHI